MLDAETQADEDAEEYIEADEEEEEEDQEQEMEYEDDEVAVAPLLLPFLNLINSVHISCSSIMLPDTHGPVFSDPLSRAYPTQNNISVLTEPTQ